MGVDEIHLGKKQKFINVVSNLDASEPVWFGRERKKETLVELDRGRWTQDCSVICLSANETNC